LLEVTKGIGATVGGRAQLASRGQKGLGCSNVIQRGTIEQAQGLLAVPQREHGLDPEEQGLVGEGMS
jgi:hypothetical protein